MHHRCGEVSIIYIRVGIGQGRRVSSNGGRDDGRMLNRSVRGHKWIAEFRQSE